MHNTKIYTVFTKSVKQKGGDILDFLKMFQTIPEHDVTTSNCTVTKHLLDTEHHADFFKLTTVTNKQLNSHLLKFAKRIAIMYQKFDLCIQREIVVLCFGNTNISSLHHKILFNYFIPINYIIKSFYLDSFLDW